MKRIIFILLAITVFSHESEARQPQCGNRGFLELSNGVRSDNFGVLDLHGNLNSPTIGYRFNRGRKMGGNLGAGLTLAGYRAEHYEGTMTGPDSFEIQYVDTKHHIRPYFSFRIGIDF